MEKKSFDGNFTTITALLVLALGYPTFKSLTSEPAESLAAVQNLKSIEKSVVDVAVEDGSRLPASVSPIQTLNKSVLGSGPLTINVACEKDLKSISTTSAQLRLKGALCEKDSVGNYIITNLSNGYTAEVMEIEGRLFTTDFINLREGENLIEIIKLGKGGEKPSQKFKVTRLPASPAI